MVVLLSQRLCTPVEMYEGLQCTHDLCGCVPSQTILEWTVTGQSV